MAIDDKDSGTIDIFNNTRGRPRIYGSNAERQKAYRERLRQNTMSGVDAKTITTKEGGND